MATLRLAVLFALLSGFLRGQGVVGEAPDGSNWPHPAAPAGNPFPRSTAPAAERIVRDRKVGLGKALFWDEQVSIDNTMACGTCHAPRHGGTDGRTLGGSPGVVRQIVNAAGQVDYDAGVRQVTHTTQLPVTEIAAPTMIGAYLFGRLFWDRRAGPGFHAEASTTALPGFGSNAALEALAVEPPLSPVEMGHEGLTWSQPRLRQKLAQARPLALVDPSSIPPDILWVAQQPNYAVLFDAVFASDPLVGGQVGVTRERFAMAVAHYQRTLIPDHAPIDLGTMTQDQIDGFAIMRDRVGGQAPGCFSCHSVSGAPALTPPPRRLVNAFDNLFSDGQQHSIGLDHVPARKTPTLRNLGLHTKFFSTGLAATPIELVRLYNRNCNPACALQHGPIELLATFTPPLTAAEETKVVAFLFDALTDPRVRDELPPFDRPKLRSEMQPFGQNVFGVGTAPPGSGGVPAMLAHVPLWVPRAGEPDVSKIAVTNVPVGGVAEVMFSLAPGAGPVGWLAAPIFTAPSGPRSPNGVSTYRPSFPLSTALIGTPLFFQFRVGDIGANFGYSNAAMIVPF